jgi:hypothetical protein
MADRVLISPGVYDREIDGTFRPASPIGVGSAIVVQRSKGPAMEPILLKDRDEDEQYFGLPSTSGKDFGAYTARTYLGLETNPLTQIRVLGMDDTGVQPGFDIPGVTGGLYAIGASGSNVCALIISSGSISLGGAMTSSVDDLAISIAGYGDVTASLNKSSSKYLKKVLNTDPSQYSTQKHIVYAVYNYANKTPASNNAFFAARVPGGNNWQDSFITGSTTEVISQPFGVTEYGLFGVGNRFAGVSANEQFKITIMNLKKSTNSSVDEFGTFTLLVRAYDDNDRNPVVLESFSGLSLNPESPNYICRVIGDSYRVWNKSQKKFDEFGDYENKSKYIYIIPSLDLKNGNCPESSLPFGFRGIRGLVSGAFSSKASFPEAPFVSNLLYKNDFNTRVCWGTAVVNNSSGSLNDGVLDRALHLPKALMLASGSTTRQFSLKWISASVGSVAGFSDASRMTDVQIQTLSTSIQYNTGTLTPTTSGSSGFTGYLSLENIENTPLAKFTMIVSDGFDGTDITKANPFDPSDMSSVSTYQTYAYRTALDMLSNPEEIELKDLALPGIWAQKVTDYATDMVEARADMFYIMDLSGSTVDDVINHITAKNVDSNYVACYYSDLSFEDKTNNKIVTVPPSVVMPAVFAYSDQVSYAWYAPAGFSRGGLGIHGVKKAKDKLKKSDRDRLQENRINPIASFTGEGPVVWGQVTLQKAPSALDRINVRRMLITVRKMIAKEATKIVFEPNVAATWDKFVNKVEPKLEVIRKNFGIDEFKLILDESTTSEDMIERNIMFAKIAIKPTRSAEKILLDFFVTNNAAGFDE